MRMTLRLRAHEWLADRFSWIQYPDLRKEAYRQQHPKPGLLFHYRRLTWKQVCWVWFGIFWAIVSLLATTGPTG